MGGVGGVDVGSWGAEGVEGSQAAVGPAVMQTCDFDLLSKSRLGSGGGRLRSHMWESSLRCHTSICPKSNQRSER